MDTVPMNCLDLNIPGSLGVRQFVWLQDLEGRGVASCNEQRMHQVSNYESSTPGQVGKWECLSLKQWLPSLPIDLNHPSNWI